MLISFHKTVMRTVKLMVAKIILYRKHSPSMSLNTLISDNGQTDSNRPKVLSSNK